MAEDRHVIETLGKVRVVIENGEITEVGSSEMKYCPMFHAMHKVDELNEEFIRKALEVNADALLPIARSAPSGSGCGHPSG